MTLIRLWSQVVAMVARDYGKFARKKGKLEFSFFSVVACMSHLACDSRESRADDVMIPKYVGVDALLKVLL